MSSCPQPLIGIPARLDSARLPRKALLEINGQAMITQVYQRVNQLSSATHPIVFTDSQEISDVITQGGGRALLNKAPCSSGTARVARGALRLAQDPKLKELTQGWDQSWVINVQGDEPLIPLESLNQLIGSLEAWRARGVQVVTLACQDTASGSARLRDDQPEYVKLCVRSDQRALFFSRANIGAGRALRHIGVYAFHLSVAELLLMERTALSLAEDLEQLSWLERGLEIGVEQVSAHPKGVDTPDDLARVRSIFSRP